MESLYEPKEVIYTGYQLEVLEELNNTRLENGLGILIPEEILTIGSRNHAIYMDRIQEANHDNLMFRITESHALRFGEILAVNFITPASEISAFETSLSHRDIMLGAIYTHCGIYKEGNYLCIDLANYKK